jgi:hypothetical protein
VALGQGQVSRLEGRPCGPLLVTRLKPHGDVIAGPQPADLDIKRDVIQQDAIADLQTSTRPRVPIAEPDSEGFR